MQGSCGIYGGEAALFGCPVGRRRLVYAWMESERKKRERSQMNELHIREVGDEQGQVFWWSEAERKAHPLVRMKVKSFDRLPASVRASLPLGFRLNPFLDDLGIHKIRSLAGPNRAFFPDEPVNSGSD